MLGALRANAKSGRAILMDRRTTFVGTAENIEEVTDDEVITGPYNSVRGMNDGDLVKVDNNPKKK